MLYQFATLYDILIEINTYFLEHVWWSFNIILCIRLLLFAHNSLFIIYLTYNLL